MDQTAANSLIRDGGQVIIRPATMATSAGTVISRIESILEAILDCVSEGKELSIDFVLNRSGHSPQKVHFPGRNAQEATKFGTHHCSSELILRAASHLANPSPDTPHLAARPRRSGLRSSINQAVSTIQLLQLPLLDLNRNVSIKQSHFLSASGAFCEPENGR